MSVLSYNEITPKTVIIYNNEPCLVVSSHVFRKQKRKPVNITKLKSLISGKVIEQTFHQSETAQEADIETQKVEYIYSNNDEHWFHPEGKPGERFSLPAVVVGEEIKFLKPKSVVEATMFNDEIFGIKIPVKVDLAVKETMPAVKGNTSQGATKEVTLETGVVIQAPMFINEGDVLSINTETGEYSERVEKS